MDELITWLRQQLDEDERKVAAMEREETRVRTAPIFQGQPLGWLAGVDIFVSSKRWRAEVEAKRQILDLHAEWADYAAHDNEPSIHHIAETYGNVVRELAQPYAGRDGWREEWAS